ncbi:MAG: site-2 protease family protein [Chloroflexia bacterium]|nr:site-2 protease family protein [Chloroflexia bacterium]
MSTTTPRNELPAALQRAVSDVFGLESFLIDAHQEGVVHMFGHLLVDADEAYEVISHRLEMLDYVALFREQDDRQIIIATPGRIPQEKPRVWLAGVLFVLTILATLYTGVTWAWDPTRTLWQNVLAGLPFSLGLMAILLAHEMGHYIAGRRLGVPITLPYFIPLPFLNPILGTMGAFIQMKAPPQNRRHLLAVGVAGPLAGLVVALPLLVLGLSLSQVEALPTVIPEGQVLFMEGNSLLYLLVKLAIFGQILPSNGLDVTIHPLAMAAWAGILVTGMNLVPAGTLDGGHVAYALLGKKASYLTWAMVGLVGLLGFIWPGWFLWALLIALLGRRHAIPLDDVTRLKPSQIALGIFVLIVFVLTFIPEPFRLLQP